LVLLDLHLPSLASIVVEDSPPDLVRLLCLARAGLLEGSSSVAYKYLMDALALDATDPRPFELLGDLHKGEGRMGEAEETYSEAMYRTTGACTLKLYLNLGACLIAGGKHADAKGIYTAACGVAPCASAWLGLGTALIRSGDLEGAEAALAEANLRDHTNARVWGYLCLLSLLASRTDEAVQALLMAFKVGLTSSALLAEIGGLFLAAGSWRHAEGALRRSVKHGGSLEARLQLGQCLMEQNEVDAAKAEYKAAEAATVDAANEPGRLKVLAGLALVHDALGEDTEANACRAQLA